MELILNPEAESDLDQLILWYEEQKFGLGFELLRCINASFELMEKYPRAWKLIDRNNNPRVLTRRFPISIYYQYDKDIYIRAILHQKMDLENHALSLLRYKNRIDNNQNFLQIFEQAT